VEDEKQDEEVAPAAEREEVAPAAEEEEMTADSLIESSKRLFPLRDPRVALRMLVNRYASESRSFTEKERNNLRAAQLKLLLDVVTSPLLNLTRLVLDKEIVLHPDELIAVNTALATERLPTFVSVGPNPRLT